MLRQLEQELETTREDLQSTIEELESANEELKASNEEVMSMNEELQSANEELETSKEELQSLNEELTTVNSQLHDKVQNWRSANNDLANLLQRHRHRHHLPGRQLRIRRYHAAGHALFNLIATDIGRPISESSRSSPTTSLLADSQQVLRTLTPREKEVQTQDGHWCIRRIIPYRTQDNRIDGVVITFTDVTERKRAADAVVRRLATIVESSGDAIFSYDLDGTVRTWNQGAERLYGYKSDEVIGQSISLTIPTYGGEEWNAAMARVVRGEFVEQLETERLRKDGQRVSAGITYSPLRDRNGKVVAVSVTVRDISDASTTSRHSA